MWKNISCTVVKYTNYNDNYYVDDKTYSSMKEMYKVKQKQALVTMEFTSNDDKMDEAWLINLYVP